jgi:hypothetical protein
VVTGGGKFSSAGNYAAPASVLVDTPAKIRVSYSENSVTKQVEQSFTVKNSLHLPTSLAIATGPTTVQAGNTAAYTATAAFDDGTTAEVTTTSTWSVSSGPGSFSTAGSYKAPASVAANTVVVLKVKYTEAGVSRETTQSITVTPPPADTDADGVTDADDRCPGTPAGTAVNTQGCSTAQITDTDGDGTVDAQDGCPADPDKVAAGLCGCGKPETANCGAQFTLRMTTNQPLPTGAPAPEVYSAGQAVDVYAPSAPDGYHFDSWSGDASGNTNPAHIVMTKDMTIQANYAADAVPDPTPVQPTLPLCGAGTPAGLLIACFGLLAMRMTRREQA